MTSIPSLTLQYSCLQQLISDGGEFTVSNAELLLAFAEIEVDDVIFPSIGGQLTPSKIGKKVENNDESITLDFDQWLISIISNARRRLMTCALGSKYGHSAPTYLDKIDNPNSTNFSHGPNSGRAGGGKEQINNIVVRAARSNTKDGAALREGSSNRPSPLKSNDRGLNFTSSCFLKTFSSTMDAQTLGSDSSSYGEDGDGDGDGDTYEAGQLGNTYGRNDVGVVDDVHSMFDDQKDIEQTIGSRPSSPARRHTMTNEFKKNLKADWSRIVASRSATSMAYPALALKTPLAPVRAQQMKSKAAEKRMLLNNGFNESFGRVTPRCLKNDQLGQASSFNGISNTGMLDGYRSFGGAARDGEAPLTDAKSIMDNVEVLKKELALAEAGVKYLDNRVDEDIVWVHSHCDIPPGANAMSVRTVGRCRKLAVEKIVMVFSAYTQNTLLWALMKWRESSNYDRLKVITAMYSRAKGIELLCKVTHGAVCRQLLRGWVPWIKRVRAQKRAERYAAATEICRIVRGYLGRNTAKNIRFYRAAVIIQRVVRIFLSRKSTALQRQCVASGQEKPRQSRPVEDESMETAVERSSRHRTQGEAKEEREERRRVYAIERAMLRADAASRDGESQSKEESSEAKGRSNRVKRESAASAKQTARQEQAVTPNDRPFTTNMKTDAENGRESVEVGAARVRERNKILQDKERERAKKKQAKDETARTRVEKTDEQDLCSSAAVTIQRVVRGMLAGTLGSQEVVVEAARNLGTDTESVSTALLKKKSGSNSKLSSTDNSVRSNRSRSNSNSSSSSGASKRKSFMGMSDLPTSLSTTPDDVKSSFFPNIVEKISGKKLSDVREEELVPSPEGRDFDPEMSSEKVGGETEGNKGSDRGDDLENGAAEERERRIRRVLSDSSKEESLKARRKVSEIDVIPSPSHHKSPSSASKIQLKSGLRSRSQRRSLPSLAAHKHASITNTKKTVRNDPTSVNSILDVSYSNSRGKPDVLEKEPKDTFNSLSTNTSSKRNSLTHELKSRKKSASCTGDFSTPHTLGIPYARNGLGRPYSTNALKILPSNLPPVPSPKFTKSSKFVHSIRSMTPPTPLGMVEDESPESPEGKKQVMSPNTVNSMDAELTNAPHTFDSNITPITDLSCFMGGCETTSASLNTMDTLTPGCGYIALLTQSSTATITTEQFRALDREARMGEIEASLSDSAGPQNPESSQETDRNETPRRLEEFKHESREEVEVHEPDYESIVHEEPDITVEAEQFAAFAEYAPSRLDNSSSSSANSSPRSLAGQQAGTENENENTASFEKTPSSSRRQSEADAAAADRELEEDRLREEEEERERERERLEDLRQRDEASARQREEEEEEERRKVEEEEKAEKERERIKNLKLRIEASVLARKKEVEEEREKERLEDLRRQEEASIAARQREEEEDRLREEEEERERERERLEDLRQIELAAIAARQVEEEELRRSEEERIKREEEEAAEKERERKRDLKQRMEASIAARRKEKEEEEENRRKIEEMEEIQRESDRMEDLQLREEASLIAIQREEEEEEKERVRERAEELQQREFASIAESKKEEEEPEMKRNEGGEESLERQRVEDLRQRELASIAARRREEEREREIVEDQRIRERISDNKLNLAKAQELEREKLREAERLREEALKAQKEKGNFGIVKGIAAILKHDKGKNASDVKGHDKDCDKDKGSDVMVIKNANEINEEDVMLLARQLSYGKARPNRSRRVSAARVAVPKNHQPSLEGSLRRPQPPDDGNPGRPRPPDDIGILRKPSDDASLKKFNLAEEPVCVRARIRSEDSVPSMSKPPLHSDDCSSIGSRRRRSSSISPLVKNSPRPSAGESLVDEKIRLLDEKLQKLEAVEKRVEERERAMEIARKVTENKALALEIRMLEFEER